MWDIWHGLSAGMQDMLLALALLSPMFLLAAALLPGHAPWPLAWALARRHRGTTTIFVLLIAMSIGLGTGILAQERAIRAASARAADPFDLIVAAPGSELTVLFATVFLQPSDMGLVSGSVLAELAADERVSFAAPVGFGDSVGDSPVVGTTAELIVRLADGAPIEGRLWDAPFEALVGSAVEAAVGDHLEPAHGVGEAAEEHAHGDTHFEVVGRMPPTGTPWDRAVIVPIEAVWMVHGLADGHAEPGRLGPPFVPELVPGVPAVIVGADGLGAVYSLRAAFERAGETMAFFPGTVLAQLHGVMGDVRGAMSVMATVSQILVAGGVLAGLAIVARLFRRHLALLAALGASARFIVAVIWLYAVVHLIVGAVVGLMLGLVATELLSGIVAQRTGLEISAELGAAELIAVAGFLGVATLAAAIPALGAPSRGLAEELR